MAQALALDVDTLDDSAGLQACTAAAGDCSLRGAILRANAMAGPHTITLHTGPYTISIMNPGGVPDDNAQAGDLDILQNITINGVDPVTTVITWDENIDVVDRDRVFHVLPAGNLTIRDVTIRQGGRGNASLDSGGGIRAQGPLTVERSAIRINAQTFGGGVAASNTTVIRSSTINNNTAQFGAGLYISGSSAFTVLIENSTISTNVALGHGGVYADRERHRRALNNVPSRTTGETAGAGPERTPWSCATRSSRATWHPRIRTVSAQSSRKASTWCTANLCGGWIRRRRTSSTVIDAGPAGQRWSDCNARPRLQRPGAGSWDPATPGSGGVGCAAAVARPGAHRRRRWRWRWNRARDIGAKGGGSGGHRQTA